MGYSWWLMKYYTMKHVEEIILKSPPTLPLGLSEDRSIELDAILLYPLPPASAALRHRPLVLPLETHRPRGEYHLLVGVDLPLQISPSDLL